MKNIDSSLPALSLLIEQRLELLRSLSASLQTSSLALVRNDSDAIARGAAHQAELCRQWSCLESELRRKTKERDDRPSVQGGQLAAAADSMRLQEEWEALARRIRYLTRVHWSLLRHLERSLAVMRRVVDSCAPTYLESAILTRDPRRGSAVRDSAGRGE